MKYVKQYGIFTLCALVGVNVANRLHASTSDTQARTYGYGYYGRTEEQPGNPRYKTQMSTSQAQLRQLPYSPASQPAQTMSMPHGYEQPTQQPEMFPQPSAPEMSELM